MQSLQHLTRRQSLYAPKIFQHKQIVTARDDEVGATGERGAKNNVIVGIATDAFRKLKGVAHFADVAECSNGLQNCRRNEAFAA